MGIKNSIRPRRAILYEVFCYPEGFDIFHEYSIQWPSTRACRMAVSASRRRAIWQFYPAIHPILQLCCRLRRAFRVSSHKLSLLNPGRTIEKGGDRMRACELVASRLIPISIRIQICKSCPVSKAAASGDALPPAKSDDSLHFAPGPPLCLHIQIAGEIQKFPRDLTEPNFRPR